MSSGPKPTDETSRVARSTPRPAADKNIVSPETLERLAAWEPEGLQACYPCDNLNADKVICFGVCQSTQFLLESWTQYMSQGKEDPDLVAAFTQAFALTARRCPSLFEPHVRQLVEHATVASLTPDVCVRLSHLTSDLGSRDIANLLIAKTRNVPHLQCGYYLSILRLATEMISPPDMDLAMNTSKQMTEQGIPHCLISLRLMVTGMSRLPIPPIEVAIRTMKFALDSGCCPGPCAIDSGMANSFFNALDTAVGPEALKAAAFVQQMPGAVLQRCIEHACPYVPCITRKGCFNACSQATYVIVDPCTIDFSGVPDVPQCAYLVFLFSTLRHVETRSTNLCTSSPYHKKLSDIHRFLSTVEKSCVIPYHTELALRGTLSQSADRPLTPQERIMLFVRLMTRSTQQCGSSFTCGLLSNDPGLIKEAASMGINVRGTICVPGTTTTPSAQATPRPVPTPASTSESTSMSSTTQ